MNTKRHSGSPATAGCAMDAETVTEDDCIGTMLPEAHYPELWK